MPNWCENILTIEGPAEEIAAFKAKAAALIAEDVPAEAEAEVIRIENFIPVPAEVEAADDGNGQEDWEIEHWGCKWGASNSALSGISDNCVHYYFQTPWAPPLAFLEQVSKDWPRLRLVLAYNESGSIFQGIAKATAGVLEDECINF